MVLVAGSAIIIGDCSPYLCDQQEGPESGRGAGRSVSSRSPWTLLNPYPGSPLNKHWLNSIAGDRVAEAKEVVFWNNPEERKTA